MGYLVEQLLDKRRNLHGIFYLIKWKDYDNSHNSWEKNTNIDEDLIQAFEAKKEEVKVFDNFFVETANPIRTLSHFPARNAMVFNPISQETVQQTQQRQKEEISYLHDLASNNDTPANYMRQVSFACQEGQFHVS